MQQTSVSIEQHNQDFHLFLFKKAQSLTKLAASQMRAKVIPGMKESEAYKLMAKELRNLGAKKFWHPIHIRFGENTLFGYKEKSNTDLILKENDIFFFDIGPIFENHEGDYGETFFVGSNPLHKKASEDVKEIFNATKSIWKKEKLTGEALHKFCENEAKKRGWLLNPSYVKGHRLSSFPHNLITKESLGNLSFTPRANVWILEVQIRHPEQNFGAFYEDILI